MRALRRLCAALSCGLTLIGLSPPAALAGTGAQMAEILPKTKFHGVGSPGFLPWCSGNFALQNYLYESNYPAAAPGTTVQGPWTQSTSAGQTAVSFASVTDTAPDGTATATDLTFGAIASSSQYSLLNQPVGNAIFASYSGWTAEGWFRDLDGPGTGNVFLTIFNGNTGSTNQGKNSGGVSYVSKKISNDGQWHHVAVYIPAAWIVDNIHIVQFNIGPDGRDTANQPSSVGVKHVAVWHLQFSEGHSEGGNGFPVYSDNAASTGTPVTLFYSAQCPASIAFRDFSLLKPIVAANAADPRYQHGITNITIQSSTNATSGGGLYEQGGLGNPFVAGGASLQTTGPYAGQHCGFTSATDGTSETGPATHNEWPVTLLFCGKTPYSYAETSVGNPQLMIPGFVLATSGQKGGTTPCSGTCAAKQTSFAAANVSISTSGLVTLSNIATNVGSGPGSIITVSGFTGTNAGLINGTFAAVAPTGTSTITYQSTCTSGCSIALTGTATVTWGAVWNSYTLHAWWLQGKCNGGYVYCLLISGETNQNGGGGPNTFLAYSNTIDSLWCVYSAAPNNQCNNGSPTAAGGPTINMPQGIMVSGDSAVGSVQLPTVILMSGAPWSQAPVNQPCPPSLPTTGPAACYNYAMTQPNSESAQGLVEWDSLVGDGVNWYYSGWFTQPNFASASFTGSVSGTALTVSSGLGVEPGQTLTGASVLPGTTILSGSGTAWVLSQNNGTIGSETMSTAYPQTDWDSTASRLDPAIYQNHCGPGGVGFFEFFATSYKANLAQGRAGNVKNQGVGYWVASDIRGPFYHFNPNSSQTGPAPFGDGAGHVTGMSGAIFPFDSLLYNGQTTIGETNAFDQDGNLFLTFNTDSGISYSSGVGGEEPDACAVR